MRNLIVHEVDLKFIERAKAKCESERVPEVERDPAPVSMEGKGEDMLCCGVVRGVPQIGIHRL